MSSHRSPRFCIRRGVSPDAVTLIGTGRSDGGRAGLLPPGRVLLGHRSSSRSSSSPTWSTATWPARLGRSSRWGAFLDSTLDRVADGAIFGGFALWYAGGGDDNVLCAVSIFCLASGQVVSYTKARGESIGLPVAVNGLVERAERLVISLVAAGLAGLHDVRRAAASSILLPIALWIVAVGSLVTLIQRVVTVRRESAEADAAARRTRGRRAGERGRRSERAAGAG